MDVNLMNFLLEDKYYEPLKSANFIQKLKRMDDQNHSFG